MSSSPLYLAIVVVWLIVLVPMLLRRDSAVHYEDETELDADLDGDLEARPNDEDADGGEDAEDDRAEAADDADPEDAAAAAPAKERAPAPEVREDVGRG
ncbi:hypothetical protein ACFQZU_12905, partial [Streptomonospora algeriensis]